MNRAVSAMLTLGLLASWLLVAVAPADAADDGFRGRYVSYNRGTCHARAATACRGPEPRLAAARRRVHYSVTLRRRGACGRARARTRTTA